MNELKNESIFKTVMIGSDGSAASAHALIVAEKLGLLQQSSINICGAVDEPREWFGSPEDTKKLQENGKAALETILAKQALNLTYPETVNSISVGLGNPAEFLRTKIFEDRGQLLVIGRKDLGFFERLIAGSVSSKVLEKTTIPTLIVPQESSKQLTGTKKMLVPLDFSEESLKGLALAKVIAKRKKAGIHLYHSIPFNDYVPLGIFEGAVTLTESLDQAQKQLTENAQWRLKSLVKELEEEGIAASFSLGIVGTIQGIIDAVATENIDLIVMSSHGYSGFKKYWIGSIANGLLKRSTTPVLVQPVHSVINPATDLITEEECLGCQ
ncbi:MAG: universal stress protein [Planctomycetota bacterium]|nr:universal stress protein [Planctomycetota bacterium]